MRDLRARLGRPGHPDYWLIGAVAALLLFGLNMVYSASFVLAHNNPLYGDESYFLKRQALWMALGIAGAVVLARLNYQWLQRVSAVGLIVVILLLVAVIMPGLGVSEYGAARWLKLGPLTLQPSELAKLAVIVFFADWLARKGEHVGHLSYGSLPFAVILAVVCGLIMLQPDLGTTAVVAISAIAIFFIAGADLRHFLLGMIGAGAALWALIQAAPYRVARLDAFLDPEADPLGKGWHSLQSMIAIGSGGIFGVGAGASRQKHYYLFGAHNDAIFAVVAEEMGLIGSVALLAGLCFLVIRGLTVAHRTNDRFGSMLAAGSSCMIAVQAVMNVAVVTSSIPATGVPLPFISYGGSALVFTMVSVGIILNVSQYPNGRADSLRVSPERTFSERRRPASFGT